MKKLRLLSLCSGIGGADLAAEWTNHIEVVDFKTLYATRAGVEGTISQGVRMMGLRRSRYIGQERTHLQHVATAAAINIVRLMRWLNGEPHAQTRQSALVRLLRPAA